MDTVGAWMELEWKGLRRIRRRMDDGYSPIRFHPYIFKNSPFISLIWNCLIAILTTLDSSFNRCSHEEYIFFSKNQDWKGINYIYSYLSKVKKSETREYEANNPTNFNNISQRSAKLIRSNETSRFNYSPRSTIRGKKKKRKKKLPRKKSGEEVVRTREEEEEEEGVSIDNIRPRK